jgi:hypothetical protein
LGKMLKIIIFSHFMLKAFPDNLWNDILFRNANSFDNNLLKFARDYSFNCSAIEKQVNHRLSCPSPLTYVSWILDCIDMVGL